MRLLLTDAGVVTDAYVTDAFGVEQLATGSTENPYRFGGAYGYYRDAATRLYVRHRHLGTSWGTWLSRDPLEWVGAESYVYGHNNPLEFVDPLGLRARRAQLCIDDGPHNYPRGANDIMDQLKRGVRGRRNIKAYFFVVGKMVVAHPELAQRMAREGHVLGNHSYSHIRPTGVQLPYPRPFESFGHLGLLEMYGEFCACHRAVYLFTKVKMRYYRAPGESRFPTREPHNWDRVDQAAKMVSPNYTRKMDERERSIRTLHDIGAGDQSGPILGQMRAWLLDRNTPDEVTICYHDPQATQSFTRDLVRELLRLGIEIKNAD